MVDAKDIAIGAISGTTMAIFGALKDYKYEGFHFDRFVRSPITGSIVGPGLKLLLPEISDLGLYAGSLVCCRVISEAYKVLRTKKEPGWFIDYIKDTLQFYSKNAGIRK